MALVRIAFAGEGGQGVQSVAEILAEAAYDEGKQTIYIPNFDLNSGVEYPLHLSRPVMNVLVPPSSIKLMLS